jgi:hypothetical protein
MPLFRKRPAGNAEPDEALTFMTTTDAAALRALVREAFAECGIEVTVLADHVADDAGRQFALWNVAAACHQDERGARVWPKIVRHHVRHILDSVDSDPFAELTPEQAAERTFTRLYEDDTIGDAGGFSSRPFAPGLVELLALDLPETVAVFPLAEAQRLGGEEVLRTYGRANLRRETGGRLEELAGDGGGSFHVLLGESVHTASKALLAPGLFTELTGQEPGEFGWLLSVPNRHQLVWHLIQDIDVIPALQGMFRFTVLGYGDGIGPLSPHVYWWNDGRYQQLTDIDADGTLSVHVGAEFADVLETLARR